MRPQAKNIKGFTLLELLVVILIIGVVSATAFTPYQKWKTGSKDTAPERDGEISGWQFFMNLPMWMRIGLIMTDIVIIGALAYFFLI